MPLGAGVTTSNYLYYTPYSYRYFWSSSPYNSNASNAYGFSGNPYYCYLSSSFVGDTFGVRPVINLKANVQITSGDGSAVGVGEGPFVIKTN